MLRDSRCLLAAARGIAPALFLYTFHLPGAGRRHPDVVIARRLLSHLGLRHHRVPCPARMTGAFAEMYRKSSALTHERTGGKAQGLFKAHPPGFVCLTGHASEIARCGYHLRPENYPGVVSVETLLGYTYMDDTPFVRRYLEAWLADARTIEERFGFPILDLFYWEQRVGSWAANIQSEWDIVHERFPPYSCRSLLETLLGTEPALRGSPGDTLYVELMRHLWPDVLSEPLNPPAPPPLKERLRPLLRATRTEALARRAYRALRSSGGA